VADQRSKRDDVVHEGPRLHLLTFLLSSVLTILAFYAVIADVGKAFTIAILLAMAFVQALFQLYVWMHMKDRGHTYPQMGIALGFVVALTAVASTLYWIWW